MHIILKTQKSNQEELPPISAKSMEAPTSRIDDKEVDEKLAKSPSQRYSKALEKNAYQEESQKVNLVV